MSKTKSSIIEESLLDDHDTIESIEPVINKVILKEEKENSQEELQPIINTEINKIEIPEEIIKSNIEPETESNIEIKNISELEDIDNTEKTNKKIKKRKYAISKIKSILNKNLLPKL